MPKRKELTKRELAALALEYATCPIESTADLDKMHALRMRVKDECEFILEVPFG